MTESMDNDNKTTQNLIACLLDAVKKCQTRFGGRTELATEGDSSIAYLCTQFELIFQHGLRKACSQSGRPGLVKGNAAPERLMSASGGTTLMDVITTFNLNINLGFKGTEPEPAFWNFVCGFLNRHEQERYSLLKNISTDTGKGKAWLRSALNEHSLERYVHMFLADHEQLRLFYEDFAIMRDQEMSSILPNVAAGLGSILFAINIDNAELNLSASQPRPMSALPSTFLAAASVPRNEPRPVLTSSTSDTKLREKRRKRRVPVQIVSFDDNELDGGSISVPSTCKSAPPTCLSSPADHVSRSFVLESSELASNNSSASLPVPQCTKEETDDQHAQPLSNSFTEEAEQQAFHKRLHTSNSDLEETSSCEDYRSPDRVASAWTCVEQSQLGIANDETDLARPDIFQRNVSSNRDPVALGGFACFENATGGSHGGASVCGEETKIDKDNVVGQMVLENSGFANGNLLHAPKIHSQYLMHMPLTDHRRIPDSIATDSHTPLTPVTAASVGELFPIKNNEDIQSGVIISEDSISIPSFSEDTDNAAVALALVQDVLHNAPNLQISYDHIADCSVSNSFMTPKVDKSNILQLSNGELRNALLILMQKREELEEDNKSLHCLLDKEMEVCLGLRAKNEELEKRQEEKSERLQSKLQALNRENELLKHQLRKYVGAVQMLKHDGIEAHEALVNLASNRDNHPMNSESSNSINYHFEGQEYERKLIQVAEMHGELMEFNDRLQRLVSQKELVVRRLREELVDLRGPLPDDALTSDDDLSITSDYDNSSMTAAVRALINVWIPSVFLTGKSSDVHHVYQIYIRIRDDEWNIYRRYAQFYGFHKFLKKSYHSVATFEFPPKKVIGNKDAKFVEERRKSLQHYLRCVVNLMLQGNSDLASNPDKETLISLLPFFGDIGSQTRRSQARRTNGFFTRYSSHPPEQESGAYTGL